MTDTPVEPLFAYEIAPLFKIGRMARLVTEPGEDEAAAATQLRGFVQRGLIHVRDVIGRESPTAHNLFGWPDLVTAKILRTLVQFGIADRDVMQEASRACYAWRKGQKATAPHPVMAAIAGMERGEFWHFRADLLVDDQTGARRVVATVYNPETQTFDGDPSNPSIPAGSILIPIYRFLPAMVAKLEAITNADA